VFTLSCLSLAILLSVADALRIGFWANLNRKPVIFDPVGVGASTFRTEVVEGNLGLINIQPLYEPLNCHRPFGYLASKCN
jgi:Hydroxyethylthiazole kinase family